MIQLLQKDNPRAFSPMGGLNAHTRKKKNVTVLGVPRVPCVLSKDLLIENFFERVNVQIWHRELLRR